MAEGARFSGLRIPFLLLANEVILLVASSSYLQPVYNSFQMRVKQ